jgi:hypothetical protein
MTLCQLIKAIDDFNGKFGISGVGDVFFLLENLSDERVVLQFKRNPYYQYFCGYSNYMPGMPCNAIELVHFRKRIGVKGFNQTAKQHHLKIIYLP